jgi:hypothetical protein
MPCRWGDAGLAGFAGRVGFRRRFGYPGRIDADERVWLTFGGVTASAQVWLNGTFLGEGEQARGPFEFEVTGLLDQRNELMVLVQAPGDSGGLWGEVALEVRRTAFLRGVRSWLAGDGQGVKLHVAGVVAGTSERPLELYVLLDGRTVIYAVAETDPEGRPFHLVSDALAETPALPAVVRVDLVDGAIIWYTAEVPLLHDAVDPV